MIKNYGDLAGIPSSQIRKLYGGKALGLFEAHRLGLPVPEADFIPYLKKKFVALITDEGGILCHAAIVAREIQLPCIVGTGIATEKLKDGMIITLDFDRGEIEEP